MNDLILLFLELLCYSRAPLVDAMILCIWVKHRGLLGDLVVSSQPTNNRQV